MKNHFSLKETKKHGSSDYTFVNYNITSKYTYRFATNHWHDETEIIYVIKGCIKLTINNQIFLGNPGDIFIVNSGELHEIYGDKSPVEYIAFVFDFNMLSFSKEDFAEENFIKPVLTEKVIFKNKIESNKKLFKQLEYINEINKTKPVCYTLSTKAILIQFFAELMEENPTILIENTSPNNEKNQLLKEIIRYIDKKYSEEITLKEIAGHFNMSYKYFCRFFKKNFNKTFIEYLNEVRIENAIHLFTKNNLTVTEIAISCGFSNMSYFTRTFKKIIGCTPSQFKNKNFTET